MFFKKTYKIQKFSHHIFHRHEPDVHCLSLDAQWHTIVINGVPVSHYIFCRNSEAWLGPIKIAFVMRCCDAGYDITLWSATPRVSSYHKLAMKWFMFILNNIDGSIISNAMAANSMAIYGYWLIITPWVTYLVLKQDYSTPIPYWPLLLMPGMESQKQINPPIKDIHSELWLFIFRSMIHNNPGYT